MRKSKAPSILSSHSDQGRPVNQPASIKDEIVEVERSFQVLYGRMSTRTYKTFEFDGVLRLSHNTLTLEDEDGVCQSSMPYMKSIRLQEGSEIVIEPKELKIVRELTAEYPNQISPEPADVGHIPKFKVPRIENIIHNNNDAGRDEAPSEHEYNLKRIKKELADDQESPVQTQPDPLAEENVLILCKPTEHQIESFDRIYLDRPTEIWKDEDFILQLKEVCNATLHTSGKGQVLLSILEECFKRNERILVVGDDEQILSELVQHYRKSEVLSRLIQNEEDLLSIGGLTEPTIVLIAYSNLHLLETTEVVMNRTIIYDHRERHGETPVAISDCTLGPTYHLITAGSIEEGLVLQNYGLEGGEDWLLSSPLTEDYETGTSMRLMFNKSSNPTCSLLNWEHYTGRSSIPETLKLNLLDQRNIALVFRRQISGP